VHGLLRLAEIRANQTKSEESEEALFWFVHLQTDTMVKTAGLQHIRRLIGLLKLALS
jgi:hypothetical protein